MQNITLDNLYITALAMLKIAYNFWPVIVLMLGYAVWETYIYEPKRVRAKSRNANYPDRDRSSYTDSRHR